MTTPTPYLPPAPWWSKLLTIGLILTVVLLIVSLSVSTYRMIVPRPAAPPAPTYVCIYVTEHGSTTVTGSAPCPAPGQQTGQAV